ncbi:hypothetical protein J2X35_000039 [Mesorhizobium sp. BE184]|nr:hypothetical protein [Mesorhizobium sp. BE184]
MTADVPRSGGVPQEIMPDISGLLAARNFPGPVRPGAVSR